MESRKVETTGGLTVAWKAATRVVTRVYLLVVSTVASMDSMKVGAMADWMVGLSGPQLVELLAD